MTCRNKIYNRQDLIIIPKFNISTRQVTFIIRNSPGSSLIMGKISPKTIRYKGEYKYKIDILSCV